MLNVIMREDLGHLVVRFHFVKRYGREGFSLFQQCGHYQGTFWRHSRRTSSTNPYPVKRNGLRIGYKGQLFGLFKMMENRIFYLKAGGKITSP